MNDRNDSKHRKLNLFVEFLNRKNPKDSITAYGIKKKEVEITQTKMVDGEWWTRKVLTFEYFAFKINVIRIVQDISTVIIISDNTNGPTALLSYNNDSIFTIFSTASDVTDFLRSCTDMSTIQCIPERIKEYKE